jgi:hypothetical protein
MENFAAVVLFDFALVAPPLAVVLGILTLALPSRARETTTARVAPRAA